MKLPILGKYLQRLADALSKLDDAFKNVQMNFVPGPNMLDIRRRRLLEGIGNDLLDISEKKLRSSRFLGVFCNTKGRCESPLTNLRLSMNQTSLTEKGVSQCTPFFLAELV